MTTNQKLMKRLNSYAKENKGLQLSAGYPSWKKEAKRLAEKGVVTFKGGRIYLVKKAK